MVNTAVGDFTFFLPLRKQCLRDVAGRRKSAVICLAALFKCSSSVNSFFRLGFRVDDMGRQDNKKMLLMLIPNKEKVKINMKTKPESTNKSPLETRERVVQYIYKRWWKIALKLITYYFKQLLKSKSIKK
ncbi:CLUMA_CG013408, isoform A [Clunio marinus]|uniref:CLUMA_CG013408, isoform A n=1 Tax=Clunio marinus TaxID=568069 RepID=A0A1J1IIV9_9DIPT|nr:CLUMA_CG013408, isoform A [Clunio marinus]